MVKALKRWVRICVRTSMQCRVHGNTRIPHQDSIMKTDLSQLLSESSLNYLFFMRRRHDLIDCCVLTCQVSTCSNLHITFKGSVFFCLFGYLFWIFSCHVVFYSSFPDLSDSEVAITIVRGLNIPLPSGKPI